LKAVTEFYGRAQALDIIGVVESHLVHEDGSRKELLFGRRNFSIFYSAPSTFLFEMIHRGSIDYMPWVYMLMVKGDRASTSASFDDKQIDSGDVSSQLSGAASVASWVPGIFASLLLHNISVTQSLKELKSVQVDGDDVVDGAPCWKLSGRWAVKPRHVTIWVDKAGMYVCRLLMEETTADGVHTYRVDCTSMFVCRENSRVMEQVIPRH
jgi:hypothetical protein